MTPAERESLLTAEDVREFVDEFFNESYVERVGLERASSQAARQLSDIARPKLAAAIAEARMDEARWWDEEPRNISERLDRIHALEQARKP